MKRVREIDQPVDPKQRERESLDKEWRDIKANKEELEKKRAEFEKEKKGSCGNQ